MFANIFASGTENSAVVQSHCIMLFCAEMEMDVKIIKNSAYCHVSRTSTRIFINTRNSFSGTNAIRAIPRVTESVVFTFGQRFTAKSLLQTRP